MSLRRFLPLLLICQLLISGGSGCGSSTEPETSKIEFSVTPDIGFLVMKAGQNEMFSVNSSDGGTVATEWRLDDRVVGQSASYAYTATTVGVDSLFLSVSRQDEEAEFIWVITVEEDLDTLPPAVPGVTLAHESEPATVRVTWTKVGSSTFPIEAYLIGCSFTGPVSADNWDSAIILAERASTGNLIYTQVFDAENDGLPPGGIVWFGIRARDDHGQLSPIPISATHSMSYAWQLAGAVNDDRGDPMANVILKFERGSIIETASTGADGRFISPSFSSLDSIRVVAVATLVQPSYYEYRSPFLHVDDGEVLDLNLVERYGADSTCSANEGDFISLLRFMTRTGPEAESSLLLKWEAYPVNVFVPDFVRGDGIDFSSLCRDAFAFWNQELGEEFFVEVFDEGSAQVVFEFTDPGGLLNGYTSLLQPQGVFSEVVPEVVLIEINDTLGQGGIPEETRNSIKGVALHELGHAAGLYVHSNCDGYRLMNTGNGVFAFRESQPIHPDEVHCVRAIRHLVQGVDMEGFDPVR